jgi:putative addiction module killer protein
MWLSDYSVSMFEIIQSATFKYWLGGLRDRQAIARINARLRRVSLGNIGDYKSVGDGVLELRIPYGPGYRLYYLRDGEQIIVLLCGGDKGSQQRDISRAKTLASAWRDKI